jgi:hypothetical protein
MNKESGSYLKSMSNILNDLGIDKDDFDWWHLAVCRGMDTNLFYEKYESDSNIAKSIDEACLSCPVIKMCYASGVEKDEYGIWGGVYLNAGSIDKTRNLHKSQDTWKRLRSKGVH